MAIRTEITKVSDYDRKHWGLCPLEGVEKYGQDGQNAEGVPAYGGADGYGTGNLYCRACDIAKHIVEVDGVEYRNYPGGRIESRQSLYLNAAGERYTQVFSIHHEGLVIATRERNFYDDSDFYAVVWNPETQSVETYEYGTTRFGGTDANSASADLADEHKPAYRDYLIRQQEQALRAHDRKEWQQAAYAAVTPSSKGQTVKVVKGRKVPVGFTGQIIWTGTDNYGNDRIGIRSAEGDTQFTAASNVVVVIDPDDLPYEADFNHDDDYYTKTATGLVDYNTRGAVASMAPAGMIVA